MTDLKVVRKGSDYTWLRRQTRRKKTIRSLDAIQKAEQRISQGIFSTDISSIPLKLGKHTYWFRSSDAPYSLQIYTEIFRENDHFLVENFLPKNARTVIDLGAHMGFFTFKVKQLCPKCRVIAVEADPNIFASLKKNVLANKLKGVELVNKAIAASDEVIPFHTSINAGVLGSKYLRTLKRDLRAWLKDEMIQKTKVQGISLSSLMKQCKLDVVDLVKLDIEDMEYEVLKGSEKILPNIKAIVMQWHSANTRDQVIELLKKHGFGISYYEPRDYGDIYFVNSRFTRL